jgi:3-hydroxyacyl-CoA dehydrogenase
MQIAVLGSGVIGRTIAGTLRPSPANSQLRVVR